MKRVALAVCLMMVASVRTAGAQSMSLEVAETAGYSTERVAAVATQLRAFGAAWSGVRYILEAAWAWRSEEADVFNAAYPYSTHIQAIEAYGERTFRPNGRLVGIRVGRYRTPFGISGGSDHAYGGFQRAPLVRYEDNFALANTSLEHGADVIVGTPRLSLETSVGAPGDVGTERRRSGAGAVLRGQTVVGDMIVGLSHLATPSNFPEHARGRARFTGIDVRWMRGGVQARGEWIAGRPFKGGSTSGGYADLIVHRPGMGPVTAVLRGERLAHEGVPPFTWHAQRYTAGARVRVLKRVSAQIGLVHQTGALAYQHANAVDVGLTYSIRRH
jgi:hypothetical protein